MNRLDKNLLTMIFQELESGHDMINFREINRMCNQIFDFWVEVCQIYYCDILIVWMQKKYTQEKHGLHREWNRRGRLLDELNFCRDRRHGQQTSWLPTGEVYYSAYFHHGVGYGSWLFYQN